MDIQSIISGVYSSPQLERYSEELRLPAIASACSELRRLLALPRWGGVVSAISELQSKPPCKSRELGSAVVSAGKPDEREIPQNLVQALIPWRKGPFNLCGTEIEA